MRITTTPPLGAVQASQAPQKADQPRALFALTAGQAAEPARTAGLRPALAAAGLETLMAVQGLRTEERGGRRRRAFQRGADSLALLDELKLALVSGEPIPAILLRLRGLTAAERESSGDAGLDEVLAEIDLRAQVEIAKREAAAVPG